MPRTRRPAQRSDSADAFIRESEQRTGTRDDLAEHLAEQFERSVTTGEADDDTSADGLQPEEIGGPFLESAAAVEYGATRTSSVDEGMPNPVPEAVGSLAVASAEEEQEAVEQDTEQGDDVDSPEPDAERPSQFVGNRDAISGARSATRR
jgi:hypothetical protein